MLTEEQYKELLRYCNYDIQLDGEPSEVLKSLSRKKYIVKHRPILPDGQISEVVLCSITEYGRQALEEFESYMREKRAKEERDEEKMKKQRATNRFDMITLGTVSAVVGSIIGGLTVYYWPTIVTFFSGLFQ